MRMVLIVMVPTGADEAPSESALGWRVVRELHELQTANARLTRLVTENMAHGFNPKPAPRNELYVVTDFGADPTGHNDSTAAIQAAFDASIASMSQGGSFKFGRVWEPEVRFPSGHYRVSDTIHISGVPSTTTKGSCGPRGNDTTWCMLAALRVAGVGIATVEQLSVSHDIFSGATTTRLSFSYMNLVGGRHQLMIGNNNTDQSFIKVSDCSFAYASGTAIRIIGPSCPDPSCPADPHPLVGSFSSQVIVRDCEFKKNIQTLVIWSDWASFSDSWITTSSNMSDLAVIENHDKIMISVKRTMQLPQ